MAEQRCFAAARPLLSLGSAALLSKKSLVRARAQTRWRCAGHRVRTSKRVHEPNTHTCTYTEVRKRPAHKRARSCEQTDEILIRISSSCALASSARMRVAFSSPNVILRRASSHRPRPQTTQRPQRCSRQQYRHPQPRPRCRCRRRSRQRRPSSSAPRRPCGCTSPCRR